MFVRLLIFTAVIAIMAATVVCGADGQPSNLPDYTLTLDIGLTEPVAADITLNVILNIKGVPATGDVTWQYRKQNTTAWTPVAASSGVASVTFPGANVAQVFELQAITGGVTTTKMVKVAGKGQLPGDPGTKQPGTITAGSTPPPPSVSIVSFEPVSGANYSGVTNAVTATSTPTGGETWLECNSFLGTAPGWNPQYKTAPVFSSGSIVSSGIAVNADGSDNYSTSIPTSHKSASYTVTNGTASSNVFFGEWQRTVSIRTVTATEIRYAYIYYNIGYAAAANATVNAKIIDASGATLASATPFVLTPAPIGGYMAKVKYYGGTTGKNLDVKWTASTGDLTVGGVIITK